MERDNGRQSYPASINVGILKVGMSPGRKKKQEVIYSEIVMYDTSKCLAI